MTNKSRCCNCLGDPYKSLINRVLNWIIHSSNFLTPVSATLLSDLVNLIYVTLHSALWVFLSIHLSVSVCWPFCHTLLFWGFCVFGLTAPAQMIKWPLIQPLPSRHISGLVFSCMLRYSIPRFVHLSVRLSVCSSVCLSIRPSVLPSPHYFFGIFGLTAPAQMPQWPSPSLPLTTRTQLG